MGRSRNPELTRQRVAAEAARMLAEFGDDDIPHARRKAAALLGVTDPRLLPDLETIQQALREQQRLFHAERHDPWLRHLRLTALELMERFERFHPRLVGSVLEGTGDIHSRIVLRLHTDTPEELLFLLIDHGERFREGEETVRFAHGEPRRVPTVTLEHAGVKAELVVLAHGDRRHPPLAPLGRRPERGASRDELRALLDAVD